MNRAALAAAIAAVLGGVGAQSAQADVASTCSFNPSNHNMIISDHSGSNSLRIYRLTTGELRFDDGKSNIFGLPCNIPGGGTANVNNTDRIAVFATPGDVGSGSDSYLIDESNGPLGPGFTPETDGNSEIEVQFDTLGGRPYAQFTGSSAADRIEAGKGGTINFSPDSAPYSDEDADVTFTTAPAILTLRGGPGNDVVTAGGIGVSGKIGAANYPVSLSGDGDDDLLAGGSYADFLAGGPGNDRYVTSDDNAGGDWLTEKPAEGSDVATVNPGDTVNGEIEARFVQFPVGRLKLAHAGMSAARTARVQLAWWHPKAWKDLRSLTLRLSEGGKVVGRVELRPGAGKLRAGGAVKLAAGSKLGHRGKAVTADLALKLDRSLAGHTLRLGVEATDRAGHRQDDALAGALTVR